MPSIYSQDTSIFYTDTGNRNAPPVILLHGCGLDHSSLAAQADFLSHRYRVIAPDLRGHGKSDAPLSSYELNSFAGDIDSLCREAEISQAVIIGHSMGGNIGLSLAQLHPQRVAAVVLLDSAVFIPSVMKDQLAQHWKAALERGEAVAFFQQALRSMCMPQDLQSLLLIGEIRAPEHVIASALPAHTLQFDSVTVTRGCKVPLAYIHSTMPFVDLAALRGSCPQLQVGATLGAGHLSPLEVPDQVNAMLRTFLSTVPGHDQEVR